MKVLILGASGATGTLVVSELLKRKSTVRIVVREHAILAQAIKENPLVEIVRGNIDAFTQRRMEELLTDCDAAVCCLGHKTTMKGIFCKPHTLVFHAVQKITAAMETRAGSQKFILMSTTAYTNKATGEKNSVGEAILFSLLKVLLSPHRDNMLSADHLVHRIGKSEAFSWVAVRPDTLIDEEQSSAYEALEHTNRSPVFNAGKTSRINVACFMADLVFDEVLWERWKYKTPVLYNKHRLKQSVV